MLAANECHGIMANFRWIISLMVQYNVRHLVLSLWKYPDPCITARSLDPARFNALAYYALYHFKENIRWYCYLKASKVILYHLILE